MTRNEAFAATALQGLIAARTNLDIQQEIETAWRYADAMEAVAKQRDILDLAAEGREDLPVTITAKAAFHLPLMELTHCFTDVCQFTFPPRTERTE